LVAHGSTAPHAGQIATKAADRSHHDPPLLTIRAAELATGTPTPAIASTVWQVGERLLLLRRMLLVQAHGSPIRGLGERGRFNRMVQEFRTGGVSSQPTRI
jgi:hypothetical protein